tara:strand:- start:355 stop:498 length:144 start_codon:yes stop_codon:yes gene_type:complete
MFLFHLDYLDYIMRFRLHRQVAEFYFHLVHHHLIHLVVLLETSMVIV